MKKIYTMIGQQELSKSYYGNQNRELYKSCTQSVLFPITTYISTIIKPTDSFSVVLVDSFNNERSHKNIELLKEELRSIFNNTFDISVVNANFEYTQKAQIETFIQLYKTFEEGDEIYFDITFGLKPTPMTVFVSCNYAQQFIKNIKIKKMVYAHYDFNQDEDYIHPIIDITSLFLLNDLISTLSDMDSSSPMQFIERVFNVKS